VVDSNDSSDDADYAPREEVQNRILSSANRENPTDSTSDASPGQFRPKVGKAKEKRARKAAQQTAGGEDALFKCGMCKEEFPSKTKLFGHIRDEEHAQPISATAAKGKKTGKGKKGRD
jgi:DnaJ homolog subfamily A member 5